MISVKDWKRPRAVLTGLALLILVTLGGLRLHDLYGAAQQRASDYAYQPISKPGFRIDGASMVPTPSYRPTCSNPHSREDAELCAQWAAVHQVAETNRIASLNLQLAIISMVGTFIATAFLVWTFYETRKTTRRELRAYVYPGIFKVEQTGGSNWRVYAPLINGGNTPATDVRTTFVAKVVPFPVQLADLPKAPLGGVLYSALGPKAERQVNASVLIGPATQADIVAEKKCVVAQMAVGYTTFSGEEIVEPVITTVVKGADLADGRMRLLTPRALERLARQDPTSSPGAREDSIRTS